MARLDPTMIEPFDLWGIYPPDLPCRSLGCTVWAQETFVSSMTLRHHAPDSAVTDLQTFSTYPESLEDVTAKVIAWLRARHPAAAEEQGCQCGCC